MTDPILPSREEQLADRAGNGRLSLIPSCGEWVLADSVVFSGDLDEVEEFLADNGY